MRQTVLDNYWSYTVAKEGYTAFLYCDILNLVTSGIGNLIDAGPNHNWEGATSAQRARMNNVVSAAAMTPAMRLPWRKRGPGWTIKEPVAGELVSPAEVADAWTKVKRQNEVVPDFSQKGGFAYAGLTDITLSVDAIRELFYSTLRDFNAKLATKYPEFESWPADAQRATLSMAWAMGPNFNFPAFKAAVDRKDFASAAVQSYFQGGGGTWDNRTGRNLENFEMFEIADGVIRMDMDPEPIRWGPKNSAGTPSTPTPVAAPHNPFLAEVAPSPNPGIGTAAVATAGAGGLCFGLYKWWKGRKR